MEQARPRHQSGRSSSSGSSSSSTSSKHGGGESFSGGGNSSSSFHAQGTVSADHNQVKYSGQYGATSRSSSGGGSSFGGAGAIGEFSSTVIGNGSSRSTTTGSSKSRSSSSSSVSGSYSYTEDLSPDENEFTTVVVLNSAGRSANGGSDGGGSSGGSGGSNNQSDSTSSSKITGKENSKTVTVARGANGYSISVSEITSSGTDKTKDSSSSSASRSESEQDGESKSTAPDGDTVTTDSNSERTATRTFTSGGAKEGDRQSLTTTGKSSGSEKTTKEYATPLLIPLEVPYSPRIYVPSTEYVTTKTFGSDSHYSASHSLAADGSAKNGTLTASHFEFSVYESGDEGDKQSTTEPYGDPEYGVEETVESELKKASVTNGSAVIQSEQGSYGDKKGYKGSGTSTHVSFVWTTYEGEQKTSYDGPEENIYSPDVSYKILQRSGGVTVTTGKLKFSATGTTSDVTEENNANHFTRVQTNSEWPGGDNFRFVDSVTDNIASGPGSNSYTEDYHYGYASNPDGWDFTNYEETERTDQGTSNRPDPGPVDGAGVSTGSIYGGVAGGTSHADMVDMLNGTALDASMNDLSAALAREQYRRDNPLTDLYEVPSPLDGPTDAEVFWQFMGIESQVVGIVNEPVDWINTAWEIWNEPTNPWSYAGLLPFVPAGVKRLGDHVDEAADVAADAVKQVHMPGTAVAQTPSSPALKGSPYHPDEVAKRIKPEYRSNPAHGEKLRPGKTPEPPDAASVYENAIRIGMGKWYGIGANGKIYQFFGDNAGGAHFAGYVDPWTLLKGIRQQLGF